MSIKNQIEVKRLRKKVREKHAKDMELLGNVRKSLWIKLKNKYGNIVYKLVN